MVVNDKANSSSSTIGEIITDQAVRSIEPISPKPTNGFGKNDPHELVRYLKITDEPLVEDQNQRSKIEQLGG